MKSARLGAIGTRPDAFKTVRYSEKLLEASGIAVSVIDFSEVFGNANRLGDDDAKTMAKLDEIRAHMPHPTVPPEKLVKMAKLGVVVDDWMADNDLDATAMQCWSSLQENYGVNVCTLMSIMSNKLMPSACETDITGLASMYALQLAAEQPAAIVDLNNNYGDDPDKCVLFHCGNWPLNFYPEGEAEMQIADVLGTTLGDDNVYGAINGRAPAAPLTIARISTDDVNGKCKAYVAEGQFLDDPLDTFGSARGRGDPQLPATAEAHLQGRLRAPLRHEPRAHRGRRGRGARELPRLGGLPTCVAKTGGAEGVKGDSVDVYITDLRRHQECGISREPSGSPP